MKEDKQTFHNGKYAGLIRIPFWFRHSIKMHGSELCVTLTHTVVHCMYIYISIGFTFVLHTQPFIAKKFKKVIFGVDLKDSVYRQPFFNLLFSLDFITVSPITSFLGILSV